MSETFPPFVECEVTPRNQLLAKRTEEYGSHLPQMEMYEKLFLFLWWWLVVLMVITSCYVVYLGFFFHPRFRLWKNKHFKRPSYRHEHSNEKVIEETMSRLDYGDAYLVNCFKTHLSSCRFYTVLCKLAYRDLEGSLPEVVVEGNGQQGPPGGKGQPGAKGHPLQATMVHPNGVNAMGRPQPGPIGFVHPGMGPNGRMRQ